MDTIALSKPGRQPRTPGDAVALLKADHRQVKNWFQEFKRVHTLTQKNELATQDRSLHHEAIVEHEAAEKLIADIREQSAQDDYFEARILLLSDMIIHHVKMEERPGGLFATARKSSMDLVTLGQLMVRRKSELQNTAHVAA
jgi:hypothetical protein